MPKKRQRPEEHARFVAHGCKQWVVNAAELEDALVDVVLSVRGTDDYEMQVKDWILARDNHRRAADEAVQRAQFEVRRLEKELGSLVKTISLTAGDDTKLKEMLDGQVEPVKRQLAAAEDDLERCKDFAESKEETWAAVSSILSETRNLASLWSSPEDEDPRRKTLLDYWLLDLLIVVEPVPGKKRLNSKSVLARLASVPGSPRYFRFGERESRARSISSRTGPVSTGRLSRSNDSASADPTWPSAHAACALTSGCGSFSPCESTGTADGSPQLPSATATLRAKPSRPARRSATSRGRAPDPFRRRAPPGADRARGGDPSRPGRGRMARTAQGSCRGRPVAGAGPQRPRPARGTGAELEAYNRGVLEAVAVVWSATGAPGPIEKDPATFDALSALSSRRTVRFPKAAYEELVATGNLRLLANPDLRAALVRYYEELERDEEIILRNNEAFTDGLLNRLMVGEGLVVGVPTGRSDDRIEALSRSDEIRSAYIPVGVTWEGRLWGLPLGHPDRVRLRAAVAGLSSAAATHLILARRAREGASALIDRIDAPPGPKPRGGDRGG